MPPGCVSKGVQIKRALSTAPSLVSTSGPLQQSQLPYPTSPEVLSILPHLSPSYSHQLYSNPHPRPFSLTQVYVVPFLPNLSIDSKPQQSGPHMKPDGSSETTHPPVALKLPKPSPAPGPGPSSGPTWETGPCPPPLAFSQPCHIIFPLPTLSTRLPSSHLSPYSEPLSRKPGLVLGCPKAVQSGLGQAHSPQEEPRRTRLRVSLSSNITDDLRLRTGPGFMGLLVLGPKSQE